MNKEIKVGIVDDHSLFRSAIANLIKNEKNIKVVLEAENGQDLINKLQSSDVQFLPEVLLLDINMPVMDGYASVIWLKKNTPTIKIIMLSMYDDCNIVSLMFKRGVNAYLTKNTNPSEIGESILSVIENGYYYSTYMAQKLHESLLTGTWEITSDVEKKSANELISTLTEREIKFIVWACSELTYNEIAIKMNLNIKTLEACRDNIFKKLDIKSRVSLVMYAIKNNLIAV